jgi:hypothetical protein
MPPHRIRRGNRRNVSQACATVAASRRRSVRDATRGHQADAAADLFDQYAIASRFRRVSEPISAVNTMCSAAGPSRTVYLGWQKAVGQRVE